MATCGFCRQEMKTAKGCTAAPPHQNKAKVTRPPIPFGKESRYGDWSPEPGERCHDCNVAQNEPHHPGCDWEECPWCHGQAFSCDCCSER